MRILLTGANGTVGHNLLPYLARTTHTIIPLGCGECANGVEHLDLTDLGSTQAVFRQNKPDAVLHLAGIKDVVLCEQNRNLSHLLNVKITENVSAICKEINAKLIFISSDYVFNGKDGPFSEKTPPSPVTQYGKDKLEAERIIQSNLNNYAIVRSSGLFGYKNDFVSVVISCLKEEDHFEAYDNLYNNPTFMGDFYKMVKIVLGNDLHGLFHCSGYETVSRYKFALQVAQFFSLKKELVLPKSLDFSKDIRPPRLELDNHKTYETLNYFPLPICSILRKNQHIWKDLI